MLKFWREFDYPIVMTSLVVLILLVFLLLVYLLKKDNEKWNKFVIENECTVVGTQPGDIIINLVPSGKGTMIPIPTYTGDKIKWKCQDGNVYWR